MLQTATFTVISLRFEHRNSWIGRNANHAHIYQRVFILQQQCTWQLYHTESLNLMQHPMTAVVLRIAIQETHCVMYIFKFMTTTLHTVGGGWCHSYNISSATDNTRALIPLQGIPHFNVTQVIFCNGMVNVTAAVRSVSITYMLGLFPKFDTSVSVSKLSCSNKGTDEL